MMEKLQQERIISAINAQIAAEDMLQLTLEYERNEKRLVKQLASFRIPNLRWRSVRRFNLAEPS